MRLTVLALFIALPAAAYAAVCPQQSSLEFAPNCSLLGQSCQNRGCCNSLRCKTIPIWGPVCLVAPFALIPVGVLSFM